MFRIILLGVLLRIARHKHPEMFDSAAALLAVEGALEEFGRLSVPADTLFPRP